MGISAHQDFSKLISLVSAGASGNTYTGSIDNWEYVCRIATEQAVLPLLGCALINGAKLECPDVYRNHILAAMRDVSSKNIIKRQRITNLLHELEIQGFHVTLLKGYALADCYEYPECRYSVDTDILVSPEEEKAVCDFLRQREFVVAKRNPVSHHTVCHHKRYGMLEVHVGLYDDIVGDVWFQAKCGEIVQQQPIRIENSNGSYTTLGHTDHLIFLVLHMIKHFISNGLSLGMMLDVALYWRKHQQEIEAQRVWKLLDLLSYTTVFACILWSLVRYAGFSETEFAGLKPVSENLVTLVLSDLESGGRMGIKENSIREDSAFVYNRLVMLRDKNKLQYYAYMLRWKLKGIWSALFPTREHLSKAYPSVIKHPWLVPLAWMHRLVFRGVKALKKEKAAKHIQTEATSVTEEAKRRVNMFIDLGMI